MFYPSEVAAAIDSASLSVRAADDDGERVVVICDALRGAFIYDRVEAARRLRLAFAELSEEGVRRAVRHLESRVNLALRPIQEARRPSWVHGWRED